MNYHKRLFSYCILIYIWTLIGCTGEETDPQVTPTMNPCDIMSCGDKICAIINGEARCLCPPDLFDNGEGDCLIERGDHPCDLISCPEDQLCAIKDETAVCICPPELLDDGMGGCGLPAVNPCQEDPCQEEQLCALGPQGAVCVCEQGLIPQRSDTQDGFECISPETERLDPCDPNPCLLPGRTECRSVNDVAICSCAADLVEDPSGDGCIPDSSDPCDPNPCEGLSHSVCRAVNNVAICSCASGFMEDPSGDGCIPESSNPCDPNPCAGLERSECRVDNGVAICGCPPGQVEESSGDGCLMELVNPCDPNPCFEEHRSICQAVGQVATCRCDEGYVDVGGACDLADPCLNLECLEQGRERCEVIEGMPTCTCNLGLVDDPSTNECVAEDPCTPNPCDLPGRSVCRAFDRVAICECDPGLVSRPDGSCQADDPCDPNPCFEPQRAVCAVISNETRCLCSPGFIEDNEGACVVAPIGNCDESHLDGDSFEPDECAADATTIQVGQSQSHSIIPAGDDDWYLLEATPGHIYHFEVTRAGLSNARVYLYDTDGTTVLRSTTNPESVTYELPEVGPYYYRVQGYSSQHTGGYTVLLTDQGLDDHGDDALGATPIQPDGTPVAGYIETRSDQDWFAFEAEAGQIYQFSLTRGSLSDAYLYLYRPDGTTIAQSQNNPESIIYDIDEGGTWYIRVRHYSSFGRGDYSITLTAEGADDHGDRSDEATPITIDGATLNGNIETRGDDDWFAFEAEAGRIYTFEMTRGTISDGYVYLYRPDGVTIAQSHNNPESITYEVDEGGTWYIRIRHYSTTGTGTYTLTLTDAGTDDHADELMGATLITPNMDPTAGHIETRGDHDYFSFLAQARHIYQIQLVRDSLSNGYLYLYAPDGERRLASNYETLYYEPDSDGLWTVRVRHYSTTGTGTYTLMIQDIGVDDHTDEAQGATVLTIDGEPMAGSIETDGDQDFFTFNAEAGHIYRLEMTRAGISNGYIYLYAQDGQTSLYASNTEWVNYEFNQGGWYFFRVRHSQTSGRGEYTVQITDLGVDDHADSLIGATPLIADGVPVAGTLETRGDRDYFALQLDGSQVYQLNTTGVDVRITVYAPDGVTRIGYTGGSQLNIDVDTVGLHYVEIRSDQSSTTGDYTLSVVD